MNAPPAITPSSNPPNEREVPLSRCEEEA